MSEYPISINFKHGIMLDNTAIIMYYCLINAQTGCSSSIMTIQQSSNCHLVYPERHLQYRISTCIVTTLN